MSLSDERLVQRTQEWLELRYVRHDGQMQKRISVRASRRAKDARSSSCAYAVLIWVHKRRVLADKAPLYS